MKTLQTYSCSPITHTCARSRRGTRRRRTPFKRLHTSEFSAKGFRTRRSPSPPARSVRSDIVFVYHRSRPTRRKETVLRYIFAKKKKKKRLLKRKNRGSTRLGLIFKMNFKRRNKTKVRKNLFPGKKRKKKCLDFFSAGEKKRKHQQGNVFKTVLIWGGAGSR